MGLYIFKRIICVVFIGMAVLFTLSFFIPDYHYTHYHNVKIISEKIEKVRNHKCNNRTHTHYIFNRLIVKWVGEDRTDQKYEYTTEFKYNDYDNDGITYYDLKNGIAKQHNCLRSILTWWGFILFSVLFLLNLFSDDEDDYTSSEIEDIREWKLYQWRKYAAFMGYDKKIVDIIYKRERSKYLIEIPKYSELFSLYNSEQVRLSQIEVETNGKQIN